MPLIAPFRVKPVLFGFFAGLAFIGLSFKALNGWRLWNIDKNLDFGSYFAVCETAVNEAEAADCVMYLSAQYLNDPNWLAIMFLLLLFEAVVIGFFVAVWAGVERVLVIPVTSLLCSVAIWRFFDHAEIAMFACFFGMVLGGLMEHSLSKRKGR